MRLRKALFAIAPQHVDGVVVCIETAVFPDAVGDDHVETLGIEFGQRILTHPVGFGREADRERPIFPRRRRCDDIADNQDKGGPLGDQGDLKSAEDRVQAIRVLTKRALDEQPTADFAFDAFGLVADECGLDWDMANDMIGGFALDATRWQPRTEADMMRYCYHVAGAVGVMMARVMGVPKDEQETLDRACDLGLAFQIADDLPGVREWFTPGETIVTYTDQADLRDKVAYYLAHPEERTRIAAAARAHVYAHHTYDHRAARLTELVEGIRAGR